MSVWWFVSFSEVVPSGKPGMARRVWTKKRPRGVILSWQEPCKRSMAWHRKLLWCHYCCVLFSLIIITNHQTKEPSSEWHFINSFIGNITASKCFLSALPVDWLFTESNNCCNQNLKINVETDDILCIFNQSSFLIKTPLVSLGYGKVNCKDIIYVCSRNCI